MNARRTAIVVLSGAALGVLLSSSITSTVVIPVLLLGVSAVAVRALHRATGRGWLVAPPAAVLGLYVVMSLAGGIIPGRVARELPLDVRNRIGAMYVLGVVAFAGFGLLVARALRFRPAEEFAAVQKRADEQPPPANANGLLGLLLLVAVLSAAVTWLLFYNRTLPIGAALQATFSNPGGGASRSILLDARLGLYRHGVQFLEQFRYGLLPFSNILMFMLARQWGAPFFTRAAVVLFPVTAVMLLGTGQRHPFALALVFAAIALAYTATQTFRRFVVPILVGGFVVFWGQTFVLGRFDKSGSLVTDLIRSSELAVDRIVMTHAGIAYRTVEAFRQDPIRLGRTWLHDIVNFIPFLPDKTESFTIELFRRQYGTTGSASPVAPLEGFVNFGFIGPAIVGTFLGVVLTLATIAVVRKAQTSAVPTLDLVFLAYITANITRAAYGGLLSPLQVGLIPAFVLWVVLRASARSAEAVSEDRDSRTARRRGLRALPEMQAT